MRDVDALIEDMKAAGAWVFAGGLHPPTRRPWCGSSDGDVLDDRRPVRRGQGAHRRLLVIEAPTSTRRSPGAAGPPARPTLPIEVRPFQDENGH